MLFSELHFDTLLKTLIACSAMQLSHIFIKVETLFNPVKMAADRKNVIIVQVGEERQVVKFGVLWSRWDVGGDRERPVDIAAHALMETGALISHGVRRGKTERETHLYTYILKIFVSKRHIFIFINLRHLRLKLLKKSKQQENMWCRWK